MKMLPQWCCMFNEKRSGWFSRWWSHTLEMFLKQDDLPYLNPKHLTKILQIVIFKVKYYETFPQKTFHRLLFNKVTNHNHYRWLTISLIVLFHHDRPLMYNTFAHSKISINSTAGGQHCSAIHILHGAVWKQELLSNLSTWSPIQNCTVSKHIFHFKLFN